MRKCQGITHKLNIKPLGLYSVHERFGGIYTWINSTKTKFISIIIISYLQVYTCSFENYISIQFLQKNIVKKHSIYFYKFLPWISITQCKHFRSSTSSESMLFPNSVIPFPRFKVLIFYSIFDNSMYLYVCKRVIVYVYVNILQIVYL